MPGLGSSKLTLGNPARSVKLTLTEKQDFHHVHRMKCSYLVFSWKAMSREAETFDNE